jgi:hypothetical protein
MMVAESVDAGGVPSQNPTNDGLISVLPADNLLSNYITNQECQAEAHRFLGEILIIWREKIA